jgi:hypothetical protein
MLEGTETGSAHRYLPSVLDVVPVTLLLTGGRS